MCQMHIISMHYTNMKMQVATKLEKVTKKKYDKYNIKLLVQEQTSAIQYIF